MSGFVGLWQRDDRPVAPALLAELTESLRFRGPDGSATWRRGTVGLGHTRFVTHARRNGEPQPLGLDDRYWIVGDIRLDAREELIAALCHSERSEESRHASDAALVLRAYRAWGARCVERLHGDFAFGIWDETERELFCARDRFGVRPFFYAEPAGLFLFGNTLDSLRRHPRVGSDLDELALADFLVCGYPLDPALSFFRDIRRLPAAHCMTVTAGTRIERYWDLPDEPALRYRRAGEYVEHFAAVLARAVADRAGDGPVGLSLSGGLDSGAIAATLVGKLGRQPAAAQPSLAYCSGWSCAFDDPEPRAAALSAAALGIPLRVLEAADCRPLASTAWMEPEPAGDYFSAQFAASLASMAAATRVNLDGQGGDEIFSGETLLDASAREPLARLALDALRTWALARRPAFGLRSRLRRSRPGDALQLPGWLDAAWQRRLGLTERMRALAAPAPAEGGRRAAARAKLRRRIWGPYLEGFDAGFTGVAIDTRWPFLDERVVRFGLALPALPWCVDKYLLRRSLRRVLPRAITTRPKAPLAADPLESHLAQQPQWPASARAEARLAGRVDPTAWREAWEAPRMGAAWQRARPLALAHWLRRSGLAPEPFHGRGPGAVKSRPSVSTELAWVSDGTD